MSSDYGSDYGSGYDYRVLTDVNRSALRMERVRALEAEIYRAELQLEDALTDPERESVCADIAVIRRRLEPHYAALGLLDMPAPADRGDAGS